MEQNMYRLRKSSKEEIIWYPFFWVCTMKREDEWNSMHTQYITVTRNWTVYSYYCCRTMSCHHEIILLLSSLHHLVESNQEVVKNDEPGPRHMQCEWSLGLMHTALLSWNASLVLISWKSATAVASSTSPMSWPLLETSMLSASSGHTSSVHSERWRTDQFLRPDSTHAKISAM